MRPAFKPLYYSAVLNLYYPLNIVNIIVLMPFPLVCNIEARTWTWTRELLREGNFMRWAGENLASTSLIPLTTQVISLSEPCTADLWHAAPVWLRVVTNWSKLLERRTIQLPGSGSFSVGNSSISAKLSVTKRFKWSWWEISDVRTEKPSNWKTKQLKQGSTQ